MYILWKAEKVGEGVKKWNKEGTEGIKEEGIDGLKFLVWKERGNEGKRDE